MASLSVHAAFAHGEPRDHSELRERWTDAYGPILAGQLEPDRRYALIRLGSQQFAYTHFEQYAHALAAAWDEGLTVEPCPSALGRELPDAAPDLGGVDSDLLRSRARPKPAVLLGRLPSTSG